MKQFFKSFDNDRFQHLRGKLTNFFDLPQTDWGNGVPIIIPDVHYHPRMFVYFDFLRPTTLIRLPNSSTDTKPAGKDAVEKTLLYAAGKLAQYYLQLFDEDYTDDVKEAKKAQRFLNILINKFIINVSTTRSRSSAGTGSVTISFNSLEDSVGNHDSLFYRILQDHLNQILVPHIWVYIFGGGRFFPDFWFPCFTGFIDGVTFTDDAGYERIELDLEDATKLLRLSAFLWNVGLVDPTIDETEGQRITAFNNIFTNKSQEEILSVLITGSSPSELAEQREIDLTSSNFPTFGILDYQLAIDKTSILRVLGDRRAVLGRNVQELLSHIERNFRGPNSLVMWGTSLSPYRQITQASFGTFVSQFKSRLEVIRDVAQKTYSEFYCGAGGDFFYHPYRTSEEFLILAARDKFSSGNFSDILDSFEATPRTPENFGAAFVFTRDEMTSSTYTVSDDEIATSLVVRGEVPLVGRKVDPAAVGLVGRFDSVPMQAKFGYRRIEHSEPLLGERSEQRLQRYAHAYFNFLLSRLFRGSCSVPFRPELELARPAVLPDYNRMFYIDSISHSFSVGSTATTSVSFSYGRMIGDPPFDLFQQLLRLKLSSLDDDALTKQFEQLKKKISLRAKFFGEME